MATIDPLKLLREYALDDKPIKERDNHICFGEIAFPKDVRTNFAVYGKQSEYYTLESLVHFWQKRELNHAGYVREAVGKRFQVVTRPDRKDLLDYLSNRNARPPASIDVTAPFPVPVTLRPSHHKAQEQAENEPDAKRQKLEDADKSKDSKRLDDRYLVDSGDGSSLRSHEFRDLNEDLTKDKLAALKEKFATRRRTQIKPTEGEPMETTAEPASHVDADAVDRELKHRERQWKNRVNCLSASVRNFSTSIHPLLQSLKEREEAARRGQQQRRQEEQQNTVNQQRQQQQQAYSRYAQEKFRETNTEGFQINKTATYHGLELTSMIAAGAKARENSSSGQAAVNQRGAHSNVVSVGILEQCSCLQSGPKGGGSTPDSTAGGGKDSRKRTSRTPIIIIPASATSLVTMYNVRDILQDLRYVSTDEKKASGIVRDNECLLQRAKPDGQTVPYRVIDNPLKLAAEEWDRVVAVFVQGPAWQFKDWRKFNGDPTVILQHMAAFHLKWDEMKLDPNVARWAVNVLSLSKTRRHQDRATLLRFWTALDKFIIKHKPQLRF